MDSRVRAAFAALVVAQTAHSIEEYAQRLFDVFEPARLVSRLFSADVATGFALANACVVAFGVWCLLARVRRSHPSARTLAWGWAGVEFANGSGHLLLALRHGGYFPGAATAPLLIGAAVLLGWRLSQAPRPS